MLSKKNLLVATVLTVVMGAPRGAAAQEPGTGQAKGQLALSLEELFRTADEHNTSIKSFQSAIQEAEAGIEAAKAERLPDIDASVSFSYLGGGRITDRDFTNGFGVHIPHYGNNFALQASWAVYTGGAIQSGINLSKLAAEMAKLNDTDNRQRVRMLLTGYYLQLHNLRKTERGGGAEERHHALRTADGEPETRTHTGAEPSENHQPPTAHRPGHRQGD